MAPHVLQSTDAPHRTADAPRYAPSQDPIPEHVHATQDTPSAPMVLGALLSITVQQVMAGVLTRACIRGQVVAHVHATQDIL